MADPAPRAISVGDTVKDTDGRLWVVHEINDGLFFVRPAPGQVADRVLYPNKDGQRLYPCRACANRDPLRDLSRQP